MRPTDVGRLAAGIRDGSGGLVPAEHRRPLTGDDVVTAGKNFALGSVAGNTVGWLDIAALASPSPLLSPQEQEELMRDTSARPPWAFEDELPLPSLYEKTIESAGGDPWSGFALAGSLVWPFGALGGLARGAKSAARPGFVSTWETVPGGVTGHLADSSGLPFSKQPSELRDLHTTAQRASMGRADPYYEALGVRPGPLTRMEGEYLNEAGGLERNAGYASQLPPAVDEADVAAVEHTRALLGAQESGAAHRVDPSSADPNALFVDFGEMSDVAGRRAFRGALSDTAAVVDRGAGQMTVRSPWAGPDDAVPVWVLQDRAERAALDSRLPPATESVVGRWDSVYEAPSWGEPGSGQATRNWVEKHGERASRIDSPEFRQLQAANNELDTAFAKARDLKTREDIMRLREIISDRGIPGLLEYVRRHGYVGLPALALTPGLATLLSQTGAGASGAPRSGATPGYRAQGT
jgi:hypothetical protein